MMGQSDPGVSFSSGLCSLGFCPCFPLAGARLSRGQDLFLVGILVRLWPGTRFPFLGIPRVTGALLYS
jgi:hypothetical protein